MSTLRYLQRHIFVHEHIYLHYLRRTVRHFDQSHSSPHEGTTFGLKNNAVPMLLTMDLDSSSNTLNIQATLKVAALDAYLHGEFSNTNKRWSELPTSPYQLSFDEALMTSEDARSEHKPPHRTGTSCFQVYYTSQANIPELDKGLELPEEPPESNNKRKKGKKQK